MSHIVCVMNVEGERASFTWSEGPASFEPYTMDGLVYKEFKEIAQRARLKLANLVKDFLYSEADIAKSSFELAAAGYELYEALFDPGAEEKRKAKQVRRWLEKITGLGGVDSVEIVVESPWLLPWNVIYDQEPDEDEFLAADDSPERWQPFWGLRHNLCGGRKVDPLRRLPILRQPKVWMVVDPEVRDGLPEPQQQRLNEFCQQHGLQPIGTRDELRAAGKTGRPDLLYWLSHAEPDALILSGEPVSPRDLRRLLKHDDEDFGFGGLAFLNACQTAEGAAEEGSFFEAFHSVGFAGMIGTEQETIDQFANPLGLDFLHAFLDEGKPVGSILQHLRGRVPLGLLYGTYCPPEIHVEVRPVDREGVEISVIPRVEGVALGSAGAGREARQPLPDEPYRSLAYYQREDRALFAGRDDDIERFAVLLDAKDARMLVLHGESGVGKSSFLRAGVIPYLEEECLGYQFLRGHDAARDSAAEGQSSVLFIRATNDLFSQLADALCQFCAEPYTYETPAAEVVEVDLPGVLAGLVGASPDPRGLRAALRDDPSLLGQLLSALGEQLPFSLVLVIDQGEELFTLARTPEDMQTAGQALEMLRRTISREGDFKIIFSLRTEYYGRLIDRLRRGRQDTQGIREYLLTDFDQAALVEAIERPTVRGRIPYAADVPFEKYGFSYAEGLPQEIASRVIRYSRDQRDSVLPLVQVICSQLYDLVRNRADKCITPDDFRQIGEVEGGMRTHVERLLDRLVASHPADKTNVTRLFTKLYNRQADDSLTTALLPVDSLARQWRGRTPFLELLTAAEQVRLLRVSTYHTGQEDQRRVSLGHDSLARLAAQWDEELSRGARRRQLIALVSGVSTVAAVMAVLAVAAVVYAIEAGKQREKAETSQQETLATLEQYYTKVSDETLLNQPGMLKLRKELLAKAAEDYDNIIDRYRADGENLKLANAFYSAGRIALQRDETTNTTKYFAKARDALKDIDLAARDANGGAQADDLLAKTANAEGEMCQRAGDYSEAKTRYNEAKDIRARLVDKFPENPEYGRKFANSIMNLAQLELRVGTNYDAALAQLEDAQNIRRGIKNKQDIAPIDDHLRRKLDRDLGMGYLNLGKAAFKTERPTAEVISSFDEAVKVFEELRLRFDQDVEIVSLLITAYRLRNMQIASKLDPWDEKWQEMLASFKTVLSLSEGLVACNPGVPDYVSVLAATRAECARAYALYGDRVSSWELYEEAVSDFERLGDWLSENSADVEVDVGTAQSSPESSWQTLLVKRPDDAFNFAVTLRELAGLQMQGEDEEGLDQAHDDLQTSKELLNKLLVYLPEARAQVDAGRLDKEGRELQASLDRLQNLMPALSVEVETRRQYVATLSKSCDVLLKTGEDSTLLENLKTLDEQLKLLSSQLSASSDPTDLAYEYGELVRICAQIDNWPIEGMELVSRAVESMKHVFETCLAASENKVEESILLVRTGRLAATTLIESQRENEGLGILGHCVELLARTGEATKVSDNHTTASLLASEYRELGTAFLQQMQPEQAASLFEKAVGICQTLAQAGSGQPEHLLQLAASQRLLGRTYHDLNQGDKAQQNLQACYDTLRLAREMPMLDLESELRLAKEYQKMSHDCLDMGSKQAAIKAATRADNIISAALVQEVIANDGLADLLEERVAVLQDTGTWLEELGQASEARRRLDLADRYKRLLPQEGPGAEETRQQLESTEPELETQDRQASTAPPC